MPVAGCTAVWLAGVPALACERTRQPHQKRRRIELAPFVARHDWLCQRFLQVGLPLKPPADARAQISGLVLLKVGQTVNSVLAPLDHEERVQLDYLGWKACVTMLRVVAAFALEDP